MTIPPRAIFAKLLPGLAPALLPAILAVFVAGLPDDTRAQTTPEPATTAAPAKPAPYDARLLRMAEILGSVTYLRTLCADADADRWRSDMQALIDREAGTETERKARLTAAFNRGYRSFAAVYTMCTPSAVLADQRYRDEGATLAAEIVSRFGN